jgi:hypothetical protein
LSESVAVVAKRLAHVLDAPGSHHGRLLTTKVEHFSTIFWRVHKIAKSDYEVLHVCPSGSRSASARGTARLPLDRFS